MTLKWTPLLLSADTPSSSISPVHLLSLLLPVAPSGSHARAGVLTEILSTGQCTKIHSSLQYKTLSLCLSLTHTLSLTLTLSNVRTHTHTHTDTHTLIHNAVLSLCAGFRSHWAALVTSAVTNNIHPASYVCVTQRKITQIMWWRTNQGATVWHPLPPHPFSDSIPPFLPMYSSHFKLSLIYLQHIHLLNTKFGFSSWV